MNSCDCYVSTLPPVERFSIRYGAHSETCPVYKPSRDPVDRANDEALRQSHNCQHCEAAPVDRDDPEAVGEHSCAACWAEIISPQPDHEWLNEIAMQAGMGFGCDGYNNAMGY